MAGLGSVVGTLLVSVSTCCQWLGELVRLMEWKLARVLWRRRLLMAASPERLLANMHSPPPKKQQGPNAATNWWTKIQLHQRPMQSG